MAAESSAERQLAKTAYDKASSILRLYGMYGNGSVLESRPGNLTVQRPVSLGRDIRSQITLSGQIQLSGEFKYVVLEAGNRLDTLLEPTSPAPLRESTKEEEEPWDQPYGGPSDIKFVRIEPTDLNLEGYEYTGRGGFRHDKFGSLDLRQREQVVFALDGLEKAAALTDTLHPNAG